jgi:hypothetical protein
MEIHIYQFDYPQLCKQIKMASTWFDKLTNRRSASGFGFILRGEENAAQPHFPHPSN